jgi:hypothetical protein
MPEEGSLTIDNASVQRLMDYGLLHFTDNGWVVGTWDDAVAATSLASLQGELQEPTSGLTRTPEPCRLRETLVELLRTTANQAIYCSSDHAKARENAKALLAAPPAEPQEPSEAMDVALELLSDAQMLFAHGVGAMTDNGDRDNQERNIREAGELNLRISNFIADFRTAAPRPALNPIGEEGAREP